MLNTPIPCANGLTPLALACSIGTVEQALALLECPSVLVDARDARGATPLMCMSHTPIPPILDFDSDPNLRFPSHFADAARKGRVEIVQHLVGLPFLHNYLPSYPILASVRDPSASPLSRSFRLHAAARTSHVLTAPIRPAQLSFSRPRPSPLFLHTPRPWA